MRGIILRSVIKDSNRCCHDSCPVESTVNSVSPIEIDVHSPSGYPGVSIASGL